MSVSNTSIKKEWIELVKTFSLEKKEMKKILQNSIEAAFLNMVIIMYRILIIEDDMGIAEAIQVQARMWNLDAEYIHNFRNGGKVTTDENDENPRENRYLQLMNRVIKKGVKTKVLMLSATPVNNRFNDLKNQIQLAYEGESERIDEVLDTTSSIDDIFRQAQKEYNIWSKLPTEERTTKELLNRLSFDFFEVLDSVTIARSRKHIEQYYDTADIGKFPTRLAPIARRPDLTDLNTAINYNEIYEI